MTDLGAPAPDPVSPRACQVCGERLGDRDLVGCSRCATLHHLDCWLYLGRCSTYACGEGQAETSAGLRVTLKLADQVDLCRPPPDHQLECVSCKRRWKDDKGSRCPTCGRVYHLQCWVANHGCLLHECRESRHEPGAEVTDLLSGLGRQNCPICTQVCKGHGRILCATCSRGFHIECWTANGGCTRADCRRRGPRPEHPPPAVADEAEFHVETELSVRDLPVEAGTTLALLATWIVLCLALVFGLP